MNDPIAPEGGRARRPWLLIPCALVALVCALVPLTGVRNLGGPLWLAVVAAIVVFPALPLVWHGVAERRRPPDGGGRQAFFERLALRGLTVGLVVLAVSVSNLGFRQIGRGLVGLVRPSQTDASKPAAFTAAEVPPLPPGAPRHELEPFIPADATAVVALADSPVIRQLLGASGVNTRDKLAALEKCQILMDRARILIASRDRHTRLIVVRAPGVTDPRNLYCLAGFLGSDRLRLRWVSDKAPIRFEVEGLLPRAVQFTALDDRTVLAIDGPWGEGADRKLFAAGDGRGEGPLAAALARVDRGASLWGASVFATEEGAWDLAIDARFQAAHLRLRGSSIPPAGAAQKAVVETHVPLAFVSALPASILSDGLGGVLALLAVTGGEAPARAQGTTPAAAGADKAIRRDR